MYVIKRDGRKENVDFNKISNRIKSLSHDLDGVDPAIVAQKTIERLGDGITTTQLDNEAARISENLVITTTNINYGKLAGKITMSNLHKNTAHTFSDYIKEYYGENNIADYMFYIASKHGEIIDNYIDKSRDYNYNYFSLKTLEKLYLLKNNNGKTVERPQYMWMRVALSLYREDIIGKYTETKENLLSRYANIEKIEKYETIHNDKHGEIREKIVSYNINNIDTDAIINEMNKLYGDFDAKFDRAFELYDLMSQHFCTTATPILFHAGTRKEGLISCYLQSVKEDSITGMYATVHDIADEFKAAGGVGLHLHNIRGSRGLIKSSNGISEGLVPYARVLNGTSRHVKQGGRRNGSLALFLEMWHTDIKYYLYLNSPNGEENSRARDLFYALWIEDAFMRAVENNDWWYLMEPDECPKLSECYGDEFDKLYYSYVSDGKYREKIKAQELWEIIKEIRTETGTPYLLAKDTCNAKSNQKNLGTIKSSNLCAEIVEYSSPSETACCTLSSISLKNLVIDGEFDYEKLGHIVRVLVNTLNNAIDLNHYPTKETETSNKLHRPLGIGVQGLADVFMQLKLPFESNEAKIINRKIFETMYYHSLSESVNLAKKYGTYSSFRGSPASQGILQYDMWGKNIDEYGLMNFDWTNLKKEIVENGLRNSLLIALMPTASTSIILQNSECFEPITSNIYKKKTLAGEFTIINEYLVKDLMELGLWDKNMLDNIMAQDGNLQYIQNIPDNIKQIYKRVWEIKQKNIVDMAVERGPYVCQSQSMNLYFDGDNLSQKYDNATFYAWKQGLKTLCYYTRTRPATDAQKFTLAVKTVREAEEMKKIQCDEEVCTVCSS